MHTHSANYLSLNYLLRPYRIPSKIFKLFISQILLGYLQLSFNLSLYTVFIIRLRLLSLSEDISKFGSNGPINILFNPGFWFIRMCFLTFIDIFCHQTQFFFYFILQPLVFCQNTLDFLSKLLLMLG